MNKDFLEIAARIAANPKIRTDPFICKALRNAMAYDVKQLAENKMLTDNEIRRWLKDNTGVSVGHDAIKRCRNEHGIKSGLKVKRAYEKAITIETWNSTKQLKSCAERLGLQKQATLARLRKLYEEGQIELTEELKPNKGSGSTGKVGTSRGKENNGKPELSMMVADNNLDHIRTKKLMSPWVVPFYREAQAERARCSL